MQVACGAEHAALVTACGNVWTWGSNDHGQLGVSTAGGGTAALGNEWVDVTPSDSPLGLPTRVSGMGDACVAVACGACHTLMLTRAGRVYSSFALSQGAWPTNTFVGGQDTLNGGGGGVRVTTKGADFSAMDEDEAGGGGVGAEQGRGVTDVSRGCWIWSSNRGVSHGGCWICDLSLVSQESVISRWCHKKSL